MTVFECTTKGHISDFLRFDGFGHGQVGLHVLVTSGLRTRGCGLVENNFSISARGS